MITSCIQHYTQAKEQYEQMLDHTNDHLFCGKTINTDICCRCPIGTSITSNIIRTSYGCGVLKYSDLSSKKPTDASGKIITPTENGDLPALRVFKKCISPVSGACCFIGLAIPSYSVLIPSATTLAITEGPTCVICIRNVTKQRFHPQSYQQVPNVIIPSQLRDPMLIGEEF